MTATPAPALTAAELAVVQAFEDAPTPPEIVEAREARRNNPHVGDIRDDRYVWNGSAWVEIVEAAVVEEVARAMWEADRINVCGDDNCCTWESMSVDRCDQYRTLATAAVAAYRAQVGDER